MNVEDIKSKVRDFLEKYIPDEEFEDSDDIFELGLVNSLMAMQLVLYIEKECGIQLQGDDLDIQNFRSLNSIESFLADKG